MSAAPLLRAFAAVLLASAVASSVAAHDPASDSASDPAAPEVGTPDIIVVAEPAPPPPAGERASTPDGGVVSPETRMIVEGTRAVGGTIGYSVEEQDNASNLLGQSVDSDSATVDFRPFYGRFYWESTLIGGLLKYGYSTGDRTVRSTDLIGRDTTAREETTEHEILVAPQIRYFIPMGDGDVAQLYLTASLGLFYGWGDITTTDAFGEKTVRDIERYGFDLALRPGLVLFVLEGVALDLSIGSLGLEAGKETIGSGEDRSETVASDLDLNLNVDLLTVNIGLLVFF